MAFRPFAATALTHLSMQACLDVHVCVYTGRDSGLKAALRRRGLSPVEDVKMLTIMRSAVRRLCTRDVVCARIIERELKENRRGSVECQQLLHTLNKVRST